MIFWQNKNKLSVEKNSKFVYTIDICLDKYHDFIDKMKLIKNNMDKTALGGILVKKAVVFLADGCEMIEALTPIDMLRRAQVEVVTVSINGKNTITSSHNVEIEADALFEENIAEGADIVILPGGSDGTENLYAHDGVRKIVKDFYDNGKYIGAICAAPTVFGRMGLLKEKKATCYPTLEHMLDCAQVLTEEVVVDENVITSRGMGTSIAFASAIIEKLLNKETAQRIEKSIIYKL